MSNREISELECNILLKDLGWFTLVPKDMKISLSNTVEIASRLMEMDMGVKQVSFRRPDSAYDT